MAPIIDSSDLVMIDAFNAVEQVGQKAWDELKKHDTTKPFMYGQNATINRISHNMHIKHSSDSYQSTMRKLEYIAKNDLVEKQKNKTP
jgi:hypothetical protein